MTPGNLFWKTLAATFTRASRRNGVPAGERGGGYRFVRESEVGMTAVRQYVRRVPSQCCLPITTLKAKEVFLSCA